MTKNLGLIPLVNFGIVHEDENGFGLYRCAQPQYEYQYNWLCKVIGVDEIINIRSERHHDDLMNNGRFLITNIDVPDHHEPTIEQAEAFIQSIANRIYQGKKVVIHCAHGHGRTSTFSVLSKLVLGHTLDEALQDEHDRFHYEFRHPAQLSFLKQHYSNYETQEV